MKPLSPLVKLEHPLFDQKNITVYIKRDELIHPLISGNKWRKLKYNIAEFKAKNKKHLLSFGGAFSNHLLALSAACSVHKIKGSIIVRGDGPDPNNPTLKLAGKLGINIYFTDRSSYKKRYEASYQQEMLHKYQADYLIPEGGTNKQALKGCSEIVYELEHQLTKSPDYIAVSAGTGGTSAGILNACANSNLVVYPALKGDFMRDEILNLASMNTDRLTVLNEYHFGGYAKHKPGLIDFINQFYKDHRILLDPIYTGKMFYGLYDQIEKNYYPEYSTIVAIHTGGLQGNLGFNYRFGNLIPNPKISI
jgi:1-aminocyclopropane-1-carboxylate deaminase